MSKKLKGALLKYGVTILVCGLLVWGYIGPRREEMTDTLNVCRILCDAFTIPGLTCLMLGLLIRLSDAGAFYGLSWVVSYAFRSLIPGGRSKMTSYYDYVQERKERQTGGYGFLIVVGGVCMAFALVFLALFYYFY